jgi:RHS repeat-associated protein
MGGTAVTANTSGATTSTIRYFSFGATRFTTGTLPTDKKFTGQRLDETGLYYYGARYYDAEIGRFISPDSIIPNPANPQSLNRYSYCLNNPLKYIDPSGHESVEDYLKVIAPYVPGLDPGKEAGDFENRNPGKSGVSNGGSGSRRGGGSSGWADKLPSSTTSTGNPEIPKSANPAPFIGPPVPKEIRGTRGIGWGINISLGLAFSLEIIDVEDSSGNIVTTIQIGIGGGTPAASLDAIYQQSDALCVSDMAGVGGEVGGSVPFVSADYFGSGEAGYHGWETGVGVGPSDIWAEIHGYVTFTWIIE